MMDSLPIFCGWDPRELEAYDVCCFSLRRRTSLPLHIEPLMLKALRAQKLYDRPTQVRGHQIWDVLSGAPMSTEFAVSRFLVPWLAPSDGWALFMDCDVLALADVADLFKLADPNYAVMVVKHHHDPSETEKKDQKIQTRYARKNWSSVILWNLSHPANKRLMLSMVNTLPGRDLHRFCWLNDDEIGALPEEWNWLEGHSDVSMRPNFVHFTRGGPWLDEWQDVAYADSWLLERRIMAADNLRHRLRPHEDAAE